MCVYIPFIVYTFYNITFISSKTKKQNKGKQKNPSPNKQQKAP